MNILIRLFEQYGYVSPMCKKAIEQNTQVLYKKKGEYLLKSGQLSENLYILEKGFVRGFYMSNDKEIDVWFSFEQNFIGSTYQMYKSKASLAFIQCMEDCVVQAIPNQVLMRLFTEYPELNLVSRRSTEDYCLQLEDRAFQLQTMSADERYHRLIKDLDENIDRIPQGNMASYLGVSTEALSRMRRI